MPRILLIIVSTLTLLSPFARAEDDEREIRLSPDGNYFVGWYDHDAGKPFGVVRPIIVSSVSNQHHVFSLVSVPRNTDAKWNSTSTRCVIADAPDNGGPNTWLVYRKNEYEWASMKIDPFKGLYAEFSETPHGATLFRPSILKISWISETAVSFHAYCNLGTYLITVDTKESDKNPISKKLSDEFQEPTKEGEQALPVEVAVAVAADGSLKLNGKVLPKQELAAALKKLKEETESDEREVILTIYADAKSKYEQIVEVLDATAQAGVTNVSFQAVVEQQAADGKTPKASQPAH
jgi:biopolymer transport protein ExbD